MVITDRATAAVRAVNALTARWAAAADRGTVFSAAGVWPLLAFLADGAGGAARAELEGAVGVPAGQAAFAARELLGVMGSVPGLDSALGLWTDRALELQEAWLSRLPAESHGVLTTDLDASQEALDAWAAKRTDGLVDRMPVTLTEDARMVLATAFALRTDWPRPFTEVMRRPDTGPWQGRTLLGLHRRSVRPDRVGVTSTPEGHVTALRVPGDNGIDVHLLLGEDRMAPGQVLRAGIGVLEGTLAVTGGGRLPHGHVGPGLHVEQQPSLTPEPVTLDVTTVAFEVAADHDLLALHGLFGLTTARDDRQGHFPGISAAPLAIGAAGQSAVAEFGALGFRAAAVAAMMPVAAGGLPQYRYETTVVRAEFDRPFAFLAVHRETRLVLAAGWVTDPKPHPARGPR
ncbi:proteinase inhibitor I4 serpin [Streptomyces sp. NBC_00201]|uniref:serpin family protein n=1 Tax=Streptomyces sp. NBC_00201 TaxID=2975679 RepID=UPI00225BA67A|nr:serpin family protein [Streptomyces sp. NBC_00201]MCX5248692.1 proteinase inhibitor I4 serpin [Streptomyces sp. NBC_00201]